MKQNTIEKQKYIISKLNKIGKALAEEKNTNQLLNKILEFAMELTGSDAGSIYTIKQNKNKKLLRFIISKNISRNVKFKEFTLDMDKNSISGYCAFTGEYLKINNIDDIKKDYNLKYNDSFDKLINYKTINMLVVPMKDYEGNVIGVLQIINKKKDYNQVLKTEEDFHENIVPYNNEEVEMVLSITSQVAILFQRINLYNRIRGLLESIVETMVTTIDAINPATAGHSKRVAELALKFASAVNSVDYGTYKDYVFSEEETTEFYYAAMLHDVGKIGVSENVLLKKNRLTDDRISCIIYKFNFIKKDLELKILNNLISENEMLIYKNIDKYLEFIQEINVKNYINQDEEHKLDEIYEIKYEDFDGSEKHLIDSFELENLKIKIGNLTAIEKKHMQKHAYYTNEILKKIQWTDSLKEVRNIAAAHHERCNATGYPFGLNKDEITFKGRMLAIADVFEALTARDRAYKKAFSTEKALAILEDEVKKGNLDGELFEIFIKEKVYEL